MSQLLQGHLASLDDGTGAPTHYWNGMPHVADGALAVDSVSAITHHHQGIPFTANGRIAAEDGAVVSHGNGAMPLTANGRLAILGAGGEAISYLAGVGYSAGGGVLPITGGGPPVAGALVKFDFRGSGGSANTNGTWNPVLRTSTGIDVLRFDDGVSTGWTFDVVIPAFGADNFLGVWADATGDAVWVDERDPLYAEHEVRALTTFDLSGLDDGKTYEIKVTGSISAGGAGQWVLGASVDGFTTQESIDVATNSSLSMTFSDVSPVGGVITLSVDSLGTDPSTFLGAVQVQEFS